jgi:hypothetical protein
MIYSLHCPFRKTLFSSSTLVCQIAQPQPLVCQNLMLKFGSVIFSGQICSDRQRKADSVFKFVQLQFNWKSMYWVYSVLEFHFVYKIWINPSVETLFAAGVLEPSWLHLLVEQYFVHHCCEVIIGLKSDNMVRFCACWNLDFVIM